jgi:hypothetical protein
MRNTVTTVRLDEEEAKQALTAYLFGGRYGPRRVPRGIDPRVVARVLLEKIPTECDADDLGRALEVARYYETKEVAAAGLELFTRPVKNGEDLMFHLRAVQLAADLGDPDQMKRAAAHFENQLLSHPNATNIPALLLETAKVTEPAGGMAAAERRLVAEQKALEPQQRRSEADMMAYDKIAAVVRNDLPRAKKVTDYKARLAQMPPADRREPLIRVYMDEASVVDDYLRVWGARLLRKDVFSGAVPAPIPEFRAIADGIKKEQMREPVPAGRFLRAERAYRYFGGAPEDRLRELSEAAEVNTDDFLDDA